MVRHTVTLLLMDRECTRNNHKEQRFGKKEPGQQGTTGPNLSEQAKTQKDLLFVKAEQVQGGKTPPAVTYPAAQGQQPEKATPHQDVPSASPQNLLGSAKASLPQLPAPPAPAVSPAVPGCPAPGIMKRTALQRRGTKDRPCPGCLPFLPGQAAPPCSSSYKRALDPSNPLDTNYSNLSTLNPELQQAHKELCLPRQFTLLQVIKQTTAED